MPATKEPMTIDQAMQPRPAAIDLDKHRAELAARKRERDAKQDELRKCLNPRYAARKEMEKPQFRFTVSAEWIGKSAADDQVKHLDSEQVVIAQNEADAWAAFCDLLGTWPSPREAKRKITKGRQVSVAQLAAEMDEQDDSFPSETIGPRAKSKR